MDFMQWLLTAQIPTGGSEPLLREGVGNAFGLAMMAGVGGLACLFGAPGSLPRRRTALAGVRAVTA